MKTSRRFALLAALSCLPLLAQQSPAPQRITALSYNIHHGEGTDGKLDLARIAAVIRAVSPDVAALQEADRGAQRTGGVNQAQELACLTGMQYVYGRTMDYQGGMYGNAILSRLPVNGFATRPLPFTPGREPRGVAQAHIYSGPTETGHVLFRFFATHLDISEADRLKAAAAILKFAAEEPEIPTLLAGDLNAYPDSAPMKLLAESFQVAGAGKSFPTAPSAAPRRQIDYILYRPADRWRVLEVRVLEESVASDHRPILAVLELLPPPR